MSCYDEMELWVIDGSDREDLLRTCDVSGLSCLTEVPGGYISLDCEVAAEAPWVMPSPVMTLGAEVSLTYRGREVWRGEIVALDWQMRDGEPAVLLQAAGYAARLQRHSVAAYTVADADVSQWWNPDDGNQQISSDNQGQLLLYVNIGTAIEAGKGQSWRYWLNSGLADQGIDRVTYDVDWNLGATNWHAALAAAAHPWGTTWANLRTWTNTTGTQAAQSTTVGSGYSALRLRMWSSSSVTTSSSRWIRLTNLTVRPVSYTPYAPAIIADLIGRVIPGVTTTSVASGTELAHWAAREPTTVADMVSDLIHRGSSYGRGWALYGTTLWMRADDGSSGADRAVVVPAETVIDDSITYADEQSVDAVVVLYATDGTTGSYPRGALSVASYPSTATPWWHYATSRVAYLDMSDVVMSSSEAAALAQAQYQRRSISVYEGSLTLPIDAALTAATGDTWYPAWLRPYYHTLQRPYARRRGDAGDRLPLVWRLEIDADSETVTLDVTPSGTPEAEEPFRRGDPGVRSYRRWEYYYYTGKGKRRRRHVWRGSPAAFRRAHPGVRLHRRRIWVWR